MLFYNQIKREFSTTSWKAGNAFFLEKQINGVRMSGTRVSGKVAEAETTITIARGTIIHSICTCKKPGAPAPATPPAPTDKHCPHAAGLGIWVVERGSLLRAGIGVEGVELDPEDEKDGEGDEARKPAIVAPPVEQKAEPVTFIRGLFDGKVLTAISVEPAIRYNDPESPDAEIVRPLLYFTRQKETRTWKTASGQLLRLSHDTIPVLGSMDNQKVVYQGRAALENLAKLLTSIERPKLHFHEDINLKVEGKPLKLKSIHVGKQQVKNRQISFVYESGKIRFTSEELAGLSAQGRLSDSYVWKEDKLYRLSPSLHQVYQFANRSGVAAQEAGEPVTQHSGYAYLADDDEYPLHPLSVYRLSLELGVEQFTVDTDWKEFQEWKKNFEKTEIAHMPEVEYGFDLRDYQKNGLSWMWSLKDRGLSSLLADDMGLGKTHQVIALLKCMYATKEKKGPTLVVAPTSVVAAWKQKLEKYDTGLKWSVFHGNSRKLPDESVNIVLTTYGILQREAVLRQTKWYSVIMDEAQAIKNASTISSRAARTLKCNFRVAMTGTPIENQSTDLWSIMEFLLPGYLGSLPRFKRLYGSGRESPTQDQAEALKRLVQPFLLRRTKEQVLTELPEKTEEVIVCEMTAVQKKAYRTQLESSEAAAIRDEIESGKRINYVNVLALLTRLKQICDHPRLPDYSSGKLKKISSLKPEESGKWETLDELINEAIRSNLKVVIFTQYLGIMDLVCNHLKAQEIGHTELRGDTQDRGARMTKFQTDPECKVFVCSLLAGGLGIDLTAASVCIHIDRWWNPAKENQATDRLHRFGQTRGVQVFKLQIENTVEERIAQIIQSKLALSDLLIEESAAGLKAFSREELLDLLKIPD